MNAPSLDEIGRRVSAHLRRFEGDPKVNVPDPRYGTRPYYCAGACRAGPRLGVRYVSYQHTSTLTKTEATAYLAWLDAGNVGKHYDWHRASKATAQPQD